METQNTKDASKIIITSYINNFMKVLDKLKTHIYEEKNLDNTSKIDFIAKSLLSCVDKLSFVDELNINSNIDPFTKILKKCDIDITPITVDKINSQTIVLSNEISYPMKSSIGNENLYNVLSFVKEKYDELYNEFEIKNDVEFLLLCDITVIFWDGEAKNFTCQYDGNEKNFYDDFFKEFIK